MGICYHLKISPLTLQQVELACTFNISSYMTAQAFLYNSTFSHNQADAGTGVSVCRCDCQHCNSMVRKLQFSE